MATTSRLAIPYPAGTDLDDVPNWMNQMAVKLDAIVAPFSHGTLAARPVSSGATPGIADRFYYATDVDPDTITDRANVNGQLYRDNGTGWDPVGPFASKMAVGNFASPAVTGTQDITGLGFQPKMVEFVFVDDGATTLTALMGVGAMSASSQWSNWIRARASSSDTTHQWQTSAAIWAGALDGSLLFRAVYSAMLADGFRLNWTATNGTQLKVGYKAWG